MKPAETSCADEPSTARPEVIVEFLFDGGLLFIAVRNIGTRPAHEITINFDKKVVGPDQKKEISKMPLFQALSFLGPQREIKCFLDHSSSYFNRRQPTRISLRVQYFDPEGRKYEATIVHNLEIYRDLPYLKPFIATEED